MNVYQLTEELERIKTLLDTIEQMKEAGEDVEEFERETLEFFLTIEGTVKEKSDNIVSLITNLEETRAAKEREAKRLKDGAKKLEDKISYLKESLLRPLMESSGGKIVGDLFSVSFRRSEALEIVNMDLIPDEYLTVKTETVVYKHSIKDAIKHGATVPGAEIVERQNIQIK
jgi:hypothetical protein